MSNADHFLSAYDKIKAKLANSAAMIKLAARSGKKTMANKSYWQMSEFFESVISDRELMEELPEDVRKQVELMAEIVGSDSPEAFIERADKDLLKVVKMPRTPSGEAMEAVMTSKQLFVADIQDGGDAWKLRIETR